LRHAVDETETLQSQKIANSEEIRRMIEILENFLRKKNCICYGGTAINNILPKSAQFYNRELEVPDYDFYSKTALLDAKELADIYYKSGYEEVEAKAGVHHGTFKVFVNFTPIADITYLDPKIFDVMSREVIRVAGIQYAPPNFLRMNMFLELSRPAENIYLVVRNAFIDQGVVFFGGYAASLYSRHMPKHRRRLIESIPDFDVISEDMETCAMIVLERLGQAGYRKNVMIRHTAIGELIPEHIEIRSGKETLAFIYTPIACHNYNKIQIGGNEIKVATIDTMLSFYFAFYYADEPYFNQSRILCMTKFLFEVEQQNRLAQRGLLKRFSIDCYGKQPTLESIRAEKVKKYDELKKNRNSPEYEDWFLKYNPAQRYGVLKTVAAVEPNPAKTVKRTRNKAKKTRRKRGKLSEFLNSF
jgi:hypothetical protein